MSRIMRSIYGYYNTKDREYNYQGPFTKPLANYKINEKITMLPLHQNAMPKVVPLPQVPSLDAKHYYHVSPKYGASPYTSSLVAGKMHKLIRLS